MKKLFLLSIVTLLFTITGNAQIGNLIKDRIKQKTEERIERAVDNAVDKTFDNAEKAVRNEKGNEEKSNKTQVAEDGWTCPNCGAGGNQGNFCKECAAKKPNASGGEESDSSETAGGWTCASCGHNGNTGKFCNECGAKKPEGDGSWTCASCGHAGNKGNFCNECGAKKGSAKKVETAYAKSDFVAGDEIIFEDTFDNEQLGEFPSQWDLLGGITEVVSVGGKKAMLFSTNRTEVCPLMKVPKNYLGDVFTMEYDMMFSSENVISWLVLSFVQPDKDSDRTSMKFEQFMTESRGDHHWSWNSSNGSLSGATEETDVTRFSGNEWHHVAISFNKRAWKLYIDGIRYVNVPNVATPPGWVSFYAVTDNEPFYITNVRIAKGAVPLYDRMMSDGKFITYGITFDVGKSTIKPESMGEINRIVQLMNENPTLKFSVEGHTDNSGNATSNQKLSEERAKAIVDKLVEMGISADRLSSVGKGQNSPIADNSTDEGRAKNRRVEFVKQ